MQVMTCRVGQTVGVGEESRIVVQARIGPRVALAVSAAAGICLWLDGARLEPLRRADGTWGYVFSLLSLRRFRLGRLALQVWLPGDVVPHAAGCDDAVHLGIASAMADRVIGSSLRDRFAPVSLPVSSTFPHAPLDGTLGEAGSFSRQR